MCGLLDLGGWLGLWHFEALGFAKAQLFAVLVNLADNKVATGECAIEDFACHGGLDAPLYGAA